MAKLINGEITHINNDIVADIELLAQIGQNYVNFMYEVDKGKQDKALKNIEDAALRVKDYLADYKLDLED